MIGQEKAIQKRFYKANIPREKKFLYKKIIACRILCWSQTVLNYTQKTNNLMAFTLNFKV